MTNKIELYTWTTPNGVKPLILLEELGLPYHVTAVNIGRGEQFAEEFVRINPNSKIPALVDGDIRIFESGAILVHLAEREKRFLPASGQARADVLSWLFFQVGGIGPMFGQLGHFRDAKREDPYPLERYQKEVERLDASARAPARGRRFPRGRIFDRGHGDDRLGARASRVHEGRHGAVPERESLDRHLECAARGRARVRMEAVKYEEIREALAGEKLPCAFVDLDAFDRNVERHLAILRPRKTPLRVATKSIRVPSLIRRVIQQDGARGLMCFDVDEAVMLAKEGFDHLLVAYPTLQPQKLDALAKLTRDGTEREPRDRLRRSRARDGPRGHGARREASRGAVPRHGARKSRRARSPRRSPLAASHAGADARSRAAHSRHARRRRARSPRLRGAGRGDGRRQPVRAANESHQALDSQREHARREDAARRDRRRAEQDGFDLALVNGGGTGSLDSTTPESGVTEVAAGSGFFKPHLFDYYRTPYMRELEPAAFFALEIVRRASPSILTCGGGGYVASGSVGPDKAPIPWLPRGLRLLPMEMAGEVQTPIDTTSSEKPLSLGEIVVFRHAKAGELMERFREVLLLQNARIVDRVLTYRGAGACFM